MSDEPTVACTLDRAGLAAQAARWSALRRRAETRQRATPDGKRVHFRAEPGVREELEALVTVENECCSWARWTVEEEDGEVVLAVSSTGHGVAALQAMFVTA
jgi:hypothetical protein